MYSKVNFPRRKVYIGNELHRITEQLYELLKQTGNLQVGTKYYLKNFQKNI